MTKSDLAARVAGRLAKQYAYEFESEINSPRCDWLREHIAHAIRREVKRAVLEERKACAQIAIDGAWLATEMKPWRSRGYHEASATIAAAIRARGKRP